MDVNKGIKLLFCIIICEFAGTIGSFFTATQIDGWYKTLNKPFFNPPDWIFGPVWAFIFLLMGISLYLVWEKKWEPKNKSNRRIKAWNKYSKEFASGSWQKANIILIFCTQLILNVLWIVIFFGMHSPGAAFFEILMLWFAIVFMMVNFYKVSGTAAWLLAPYILWVSFALVLNCFIWILN